MGAASTRPGSLRSLAPRERIAAIADADTAGTLDASFDAPRPSPHLLRWGIKAQDDDGVVVARARIHGASVWIAAQDERFVGGSVGARHGETLHRMFVLASAERPAAVVVLAASAGVRLHEANPAELHLARALAALLDLRAAGIPVIAIGVGDTFGGASVLACAAERMALLPGVRLGLSGPAVIETTRGRDELDAGDADAMSALFGADARARAGQIELLADDVTAAREWIAECLRESQPFAASVKAMQARLAARLLSIAPADSGSTGTADSRPRGTADSRPRGTANSRPRGTADSGPREPANLCADAEPVDGAGWLWRVRSRPIWITRPCGRATLGPREAHALDTALLAHLIGASGSEERTLFLVEDSNGHEASRSAESVCVSQYVAHHAAVVALLRSQGIRVRGLITGVGHSAALFANALQASEVYALAQSRVVAMAPEAIARVTRVPEAEIASLIEDDPLLGHPIRQFAHWGGIAEIVSEVDCARLLALAARE